MTKPVLRKRPLNRVTVASIALTFLLSSVAQSSAECGGYCEARQTPPIIDHALRTQDLKAPMRDAEFEKCKANPLSYLGKLGRKGT